MLHGIEQLAARYKEHLYVEIEVWEEVSWTWKTQRFWETGIKVEAHTFTWCVRDKKAHLCVGLGKALEIIYDSLHGPERGAKDDTVDCRQFRSSTVTLLCVIAWSTVRLVLFRTRQRVTSEARRRITRALSRSIIWRRTKPLHSTLRRSQD